MNDNWKESYFEYLTKRLDSGESNNIAVTKTIEVLKEKLKKQDKVKILDIGCFSGAMLNRILNGLSQDERTRVNAVGYDFDREVMQRGANKYSDIVYIYGQAEEVFPFVEQFDIILLSNILHEVAPTKNIEIRRKKIKDVFANIVKIMTKDGNIIILDGCRPEKNNKVIINFTDEKDKKLFAEFSKKYKALKIKYSELDDEITTDEVSLTVFLTKARYMDKEYWESESKQLYQYFSENDFLKMFRENNLKVVNSEPQNFSEDQMNGLFKSIKPKIRTPSKNILLIAKK